MLNSSIIFPAQIFINSSTLTVFFLRPSSVYSFDEIHRCKLKRIEVEEYDKIKLIVEQCQKQRDD